MPELDSVDSERIISVDSSSDMRVLCVVGVIYTEQMLRDSDSLMDLLCSFRTIGVQVMRSGFSS